MKKILLAFLAGSSILGMNSFSQQLDTTFNTGGYLPYLGANSNSQGNVGRGQASAVQADGKIVTVLGRDNSSNDLFMYIYRYLPNGMPDPSFGVNGSAKTFCGTQSTGFDVEIQSDQKIVLVGESEYCINGICGAKQFVMMRLKTNGELDSTFGTNGHILTSDVFGTNGTYSIPKSLHILPNGKFMVGGKGPNGKPAIVRLNSNGFPDNTYGTNGVHIFQNIPRSQFMDMAIGPNGEAYGLLTTDTWSQTTMAYDSANYTDNAVYKLTPAGALDPSFGINGILEFDIDITDKPFSIALASSGKLLVAGYNMPVHNYYSTMPFSGYGQVNRGFVAFVTSSGTLDTSIPNGFATFDFQQDSVTFFNKIVEKSPNEFLICGFSTSYVSGNFQNKGLIASMNAQGQLNTAFNGTGYMIFDHGTLGTSGWNGKLANFMDIDFPASNKILLTGYRNPVGGATKGSIYLLQLTYGAASNLAVTEFSQAAFSVYPNPVSDNQFVISSEEAAAIELISIDGRVLYQREISTGISPVTLPGDFKGTAILRIQTTSGKTGIQKLIFD